MAVPKGKQSKRRTNNRFANYKAQSPTLVDCPQCHELKEAHKVCGHCGYYDKTVVISHEEKKAD